MLCHARSGKGGSDLFIQVEFIEAIWGSAGTTILMLSRLDKAQRIKTSKMTGVHKFLYH